MGRVLRKAGVGGLVVWASLWCVQAFALGVADFSPQGMHSELSRVQVEFDAAAVALGDTSAPDPYRISCDAKPAVGAGRWIDERHWQFEFAKPLTGSARCQARANSSFAPIDGSALAAPDFAFATGRPELTSVQPWGGEISEDQAFILRFNTEVDKSSLLQNAYCEIEGVGEAVAVRLVQGAARALLLEHNFWGAQEDLAKVQILQCRRSLPAGAKVNLVVQNGYRAKAGAAGALGPAAEDGFGREFEVRAPFSASLSCTRSNAQAPCSPLFPLRLVFSSPVARELARGVILQGPQGRILAEEFAAGAEQGDTLLDSISFKGPLPESARFSLILPDEFKDDAGRALENAARFPLEFSTDALPPLLKFASGEFGLVERFADGPPGSGVPPSVPLALRRVEAELLSRELSVSAGTLSDHVSQDDFTALQWYARVARLQEGHLSAGQFADTMALREQRRVAEDEPLIDVRSLSLLENEKNVQQLQLPGVADMTAADIEMIGVPLAKPGLHIIEVASPRLGSALLDAAAPGAAAQMYVRTAVLVSNLAVHMKTGRDDTMVWVTTLDTAEPVAEARVAVLSCDGRQLLQGQTDASGIWHVQTPLDTSDYCETTGQSGVFVSARIDASHPLAFGEDDYSFAWSSWDRGIESWRFDLPTSRAQTPDLTAHAVLDRSLLRTGETLGIKLFLRELNRTGLQNPAPERLPKELQIVHDGSGNSQSLPLQWQKSASGGLYAALDYQIGEAAPLGSYSLELTPPKPADNDDEYYWQPDLYAGGFRVESFRLPLLTGSIKISDKNGASADLVAPTALEAGLQIGALDGAPAAQLPLTLSALASPLAVGFADYPDFNFGRTEEGSADGAARKLFLDKAAYVLDAQGGASISLDDLPALNSAQSWLFEASFTDPVGEIQTLAQRVNVWPAAYVLGIQAGHWLEQGQQTTVKMLVLDTAGQPQENVAVQLDGRLRTRFTTRKRLVGGFYAYENHDQLAPLGTLCSGVTNAKGILECQIEPAAEGQIEFFARASDPAGRAVEAASSVWVWSDASWFGDNNNDRIDVIASQSSYKPGDVAEFAVQMPFRQATALVTVEREGVLHSEVVQLAAADPVVRLKILPEWGPNAYVAVLALRPRVRQVPWSSFAEWGWSQPLDWWAARSGQDQDAPAPSGLVDLAKPAMRFGLAQIRVDDQAHSLRVVVDPERSSYRVRESAKVAVQVFQPDGSPAAHASLAFAAIDQALLELMDNSSWDIQDAMSVLRDYGVNTASAQSMVVGRRHYGRKAVPAGGGGGFNATRELFDTRIAWLPNIELDEEGRAQLELALNDSLTRFKLVAIADFGAAMFGSGAAFIDVSQDLQLVSGLPPLVREGDSYQAALTIRNRSQEPMSVRLGASVRQAQGQALELPGRELELAAGQAQQVSWDVTAPALALTSDSEQLSWRFEASTTAASALQAADSLLIAQELRAAVPVELSQASLVRLEPAKPIALNVDAGPGALAGADGNLRGGVQIALQSSLAGGLPGVRDWLARYPYTCFEQLGAKALGMQDQAAWQRLMGRMASFLDDKGLLAYFPGGRGSVTLTAHTLELAAHSRALGWDFALPAAASERMLAALQDFVGGRLEVSEWAPEDDDFWRVLIAINSLALWDAWQPEMLDSFDLKVSGWPSAALVTWKSILQNMPDLPERAELLAQVDKILRARLSRHGTTLVFDDTSVNAGWWLMNNAATIQARLLIAVAGQKSWQADLGRLANGLLALQRKGAWDTTAANALGVLAIAEFARHAEPHAGQGALAVALLPGSSQTLPWQSMNQEDGVWRTELLLPWPRERAGVVQLSQQGQGGGWATISAKAAVPRLKPQDFGLHLERELVAVSQAKEGAWSAGDIYRVRLKLRAQGATNWVVVSDPVPAGASILGSGLGRDSAIATSSENQNLPWARGPSYVERATGEYRAYFEVLPASEQVWEYTVRLNSPGKYQLPPSRAEALYQPEVYASVPNAPFVVQAR